MSLLKKWFYYNHHYQIQKLKIVKKIKNSLLGFWNDV
ncbi:MAG: hypothetical protein BWY27_00179 [Bacteroidetes bacterium ADurb.Bin234]|nr:MAG: hypothetical protein BWY27_00179 [Bacteroidetes bacterium ADurb.Bin234]